MRRPLLVPILTVLAVAAAAFAPAPSVVVRDPGPGYFATSNVEWVANLPVNTDSAGARYHDGYLYVTEDRGLTIYDLSDPALPVPTGFLPVPQQAYYTEEDVDTNGEILLIGSFGDLTDSVGPLNRVVVVDVRDKSMPSILGIVDGVDNHTVTCILDCTWAYGSAGALIDLRDPSAPKAVTPGWRARLAEQGVEIGSTHDVTEVAPGIVVTSSKPMLYLDVHDPTDPQVLATTRLPDDAFSHGNLWPQAGTDDFLLVGGETGKLGGACGPDDGAFHVLDARAVRAEDEAAAASEAAGDTPPARTATFTPLDSFRVEPGTFSDGGSPYNQYCAHWFTTHPDYADGGLVAMGWYEHGIRFLDVAPGTGQITEKGWFLPLGGSTSAAYWIDDEFLYTTDYQRGIDILRWHDEPATGEVQMVGAAPLVASGAVDPNSFFPWYGRDGLPTSEPAGATSAYLCPLPVTR